MAETWKHGPCVRLDKALRAAALSNVKIAKALGVTDSAVFRWRSGENTPNADTLAAILELCGASADEILGLRPSQIDRGALEKAVTLIRGALDRGGIAHAAAERAIAERELEAAEQDLDRRAAARRSSRET